MTTTTPRTLDSLTSEEAATCFRLAFGDVLTEFDYMDSFIHQYNGGCLTMKSKTASLKIEDNGLILSALSDIPSDVPYPFNAVRLLRYLDSLGIQWGE